VKWLQKWWGVLVLCAVALVVFDTSISGFLTCRVMSADGNHAVFAQDHQQCTAFHGPVLFILEWLFDFIDEHGDAFVAAFTAVLAVFTGRLWYSTDKLWRATVQLAQDAKDTANAQTEETRILERAYVAVEPGGVWTYRGSNKMIGHFVIKNAGRLPAQNIKWFASAREDDDDEWVKDFPIGDLYGENIILAAGAEMTHGSGQIPFPSKKCIYVWGMVTYTDGFGRSRWTRFCHRYPRAVMRKGGRQSDYRIKPRYGRYHGYGNSTDEPPHSTLPL